MQRNAFFILVFCFAIFNLSKSFAQNVGIGVDSPVLGKLEVAGVAGNGNTNAVFGSNSSGISFQQNWPTIGFNQYRNSVNGNGRFMSTGYATIQYVNPGDGTLGIDMLGYGGINDLTSSGTRALTILNNGNVGILNGGGDASLWVSRGTGGNGTAVFAGTNNLSHFNYGTSENTYIRAGKDGSTVFINDINNGSVTIGAGNAKVGINMTNPTFPLQIKELQVAGIDKGILMKSVYGDEWELRNSTTFFWIINGNTKAYIDPSNGSWHTVSDSRLKKKSALYRRSWTG